MYYNKKHCLYRAGILINEAEKILKSVKDCLTKSEVFPSYLKDLKEMVDSLVVLSIVHNTIYGMEIEEEYKSRKRTTSSKRKQAKRKSKSIGSTRRRRK